MLQKGGFLSEKAERAAGRKGGRQKGRGPRPYEVFHRPAAEVKRNRMTAQENKARGQTSGKSGNVPREKVLRGRTRRMVFEKRKLMKGDGEVFEKAESSGGTEGRGKKTGVTWS